MANLPEKHEGHAARHASRNAAEKVELKFSPEVVRRFADLEASVRDKGHFDGDVLKNLQHWTAGKPGTVSLALGDIMMITQETVKHVQATGNPEAKRALSALFVDMIGRSPDSPSIATVKTFQRGR